MSTEDNSSSQTAGCHQVLSLLNTTTVFDLFAGWAAFVTGLVPTYPIKTVRVRYMSLGQSPMWTLRHDTFLGLYGGFTTPVFFTGPVSALVYCSNERFKSLLAGRLSLNRWRGGEADRAGVAGVEDECITAAAIPSLAETALAGGLAGATASVFSNPVTTLRIQQQNLSQSVSKFAKPKRKFRKGRTISSSTTSSGGAASVGGGSRSSIESEQRFTTRREVVNRFIQNGTFFSGLWRAWPLEVTLHFFGRMLFFTSYECYKSSLLTTSSPSQSPSSSSSYSLPHDAKKRHGDDVGMEWGKRVVAAVGASLSSWTVVYPIEVIKTKMQADSWQPSQRKFSSILHCVSSTYKLQGLAGFWRGCPFCMVDYALHSAICFPTFDFLTKCHRERISMM